MPAVENLLDVLPALLVPHRRHVRVGELVDQGERRCTREHGVEIHLLELERPVLGAQPRNDLEALGEGRRLGAVVWLEVADHDVAPLLLGLPALEEHAVRLADSRRHSQQDPVVPSRHALMLRSRLWTTRSISLIPTNGRIMPPSP